MLLLTCKNLRTLYLGPLGFRGTATAATRRPIVVCACMQNSYGKIRTLTVFKMCGILAGLLMRPPENTSLRHFTGCWGISAFNLVTLHTKEHAADTRVY